MQTLDHLIDELKRLYEVDGLTTYEIAAMYNTNRVRITRTLKRNGVVLRSTYKSRWGVEREERAPTEDQLKKHLIDGLQYHEIAKIYGCDKTAVSYWIKRYGIQWECSNWTQRHKIRGYVEPTAQELYVMYCIDSLSAEEIARKLKCSKRTVLDRLVSHGIEARSPGWTGKMFKCLDGQFVKSTYEQRVADWLYQHGIAHEYEPQLPFDKTRKADFLAQGKYIEIWGVLDNQTYENRKKYKIEQYQLHNLPLIQINSWDFSAQKKDAWQKRLTKAFIAY